MILETSLVVHLMYLFFDLIYKKKIEINTITLLNPTIHSNVMLF